MLVLCTLYTLVEERRSVAQMAGALWLALVSRLSCLLALILTQGKTIEMYMPALSSTMEEGTVVQWLKDVGDRIEVRRAPSGPHAVPALVKRMVSLRTTRWPGEAWGCPLQRSAFEDERREYMSNIFLVTVAGAASHFGDVIQQT